jgi:hypothetical protein
MANKGHIKEINKALKNKQAKEGGRPLFCSNGKLARRRHEDYLYL